MARGRKPQSDGAAADARAKRERIAQEVASAAAGAGWETPAEDDLIATELKVGPFRPMAESLAAMGDQAKTRKQGWARRRFETEEAEKKFRSGLRAALTSMDYSLRVEGPMKVDGLYLVDYRATKKQPRATAKEPAEVAAS